MNTNVSDLRKSLNVESIRINQLNDSRVQGLVSLKAKTNIINDKVKDFDNELNTMKNNVNTYSKAISDLRSRIYRISHTSFLLSNNSLCLLVSEIFFFFKLQPIRNKNCPWRPCFFVQSGWNEEILERSFHSRHDSG